MPLAIMALVMVTAISGCSLLFGSGSVDPASTIEPTTGEVQAVPQVSGGEQFPDVLEVVLRPRGERTYDVVVTLSSAYDTPQRYADGWRVIDSDGRTLGTHTLLHDHASEQPFTRTQSGLVIPEGIEEVTVEGRDQANGFGGLTLTIPVPTE